MIFDRIIPTDWLNQSIEDTALNGRLVASLSRSIYEHWRQRGQQAFTCHRQKRLTGKASSLKRSRDISVCQDFWLRRQHQIQAENCQCGQERHTRAAAILLSEKLMQKTKKHALHVKERWPESLRWCDQRRCTRDVAHLVRCKPNNQGTAVREETHTLLNLSMRLPQNYQAAFCSSKPRPKGWAAMPSKEDRHPFMLQRSATCNGFEKIFGAMKIFPFRIVLSTTTTPMFKPSLGFSFKPHRSSLLGNLRWRPFGSCWAVHSPCPFLAWWVHRGPSPWSSSYWVVHRPYRLLSTQVQSGPLHCSFLPCQLVHLP